jgi:hypothetical protein
MVTPPLKLARFESMISLRSFRLAAPRAEEMCGTASLPSRKQTDQ